MHEEFARMKMIIEEGEDERAKLAMEVGERTGRAGRVSKEDASNLKFIAPVFPIFLKSALNAHLASQTAPEPEVRHKRVRPAFQTLSSCVCGLASLLALTVVSDIIGWL